jgi:hypothetical protein
MESTFLFPKITISSKQIIKLLFLLLSSYQDNLQKLIDLIMMYQIPAGI